MRKPPAAEPWQHRFVEANGLRFHVVVSGPFALRYLPGVSHWVQQEAPVRVNDLSLGFLRRPRRPAP